MTSNEVKRAGNAGKEKDTMKENLITRRSMLKGMGLLAAGATAFELGLPRPVRAANGVAEIIRDTRAAEEAERPWFALGIIGEPLMDERLLWYLSQTWERNSDIGECLDTASRIKAGDAVSWFEEWLKTAERVRGYGDQSLEAGHGLSAGEAYMRAANYYRAALIHYGSPEEDPRVLDATVKSAECFDKAIELLSIPAQPVRIPYEDTTLPGYFFRSPIAEEKAPVIIMQQGWDAWPEETIYIPEGAIKRGYHSLIFHGPGQGRALREQGLVYRPDWEAAVTPVVDFVISQPGVDPDRIALMGNSMGGFLAPRAAAFEKRLKICIANPGCLNWAEAIFAHFADYPQLFELLEADPDTFDAAVEQFFGEAPAEGEGEGYLASGYWWLKAKIWKHGAKSPSDLFLKLKEYNNEPFVGQIECHVLVIDGEAEFTVPGQPQKLYDALQCPKDYMMFTAEDTGLCHCQTGALAISSQRIFDWLDEHL
jgi:dienelactone hydrolase